MKRLDLGLFLLLLLCAIAVVHTQHRARRLFVDRERERSVAEQLAADLRRLQSDQATLAAANRVERVAAGMHMLPPDPARTVAISALPVMAGSSPVEGAATANAASGNAAPGDGSMAGGAVVGGPSAPGAAGKSPATLQLARVHPAGGSR